jgi:hypothetical protein
MEKKAVEIERQGRDGRVHREIISGNEPKTLSSERSKRIAIE